MDLNIMSMESLKQLQFNLISELLQQEFVDEQFQRCYSLKKGNGPSFFLDLLAHFVADVPIVFQEMIQTLNKQVVNFGALYTLCMKLKGSALSIGACRVSKACARLGEAVVDGVTGRCFSELNIIREEYENLRPHLDRIFQVEQEIISRAP